MYEAMETLLHILRPFSHGSSFFPTGDRDYTGSTVTVTFQPGEVQEYVNVTILDDDVLEGVEIFTATLTTDDSNVDISSDNTATITIVDHNSELLYLSHSSQELLLY